MSPLSFAGSTTISTSFTTGAGFVGYIVFTMPPELVVCVVGGAFLSPFWGPLGPA